MHPDGDPKRVSFIVLKIKQCVPKSTTLYPLQNGINRKSWSDTDTMHGTNRNEMRTK